MRVLALHTDVIVFVSRVWQTTCTAVRAGEEGFVIDSPVYPDELAAVPGVLDQAGFPVSGLVATHGDWDHLLGRLAFPEAALGCAESTAQRLSAAAGEAQRALRRFDEQHYVDRGRPLTLARLQSLPVPGRLSIGHERELELFPATGHTPDGMAIRIPWAGALVSGDYLCSVEIPMISEGGSVDDYLATLARLEPVLATVETVVPGHGAPYPAADARTVLAEDRAYLEALAASGRDAALPARRRTGEQRRIHAENAARIHA